MEGEVKRKCKWTRMLKYSKEVSCFSNNQSVLAAQLTHILDLYYHCRVAVRVVVKWSIQSEWLVSYGRINTRDILWMCVSAFRRFFDSIADFRDG